MAQSLTHSHESHIEPGIGDQLEAALLPKGDTDTRARIGLLEQMLIDICACSGVTLPRSIRERVGDLVDLSAEHDLGDFFGSGLAGED